MFAISTLLSNIIKFSVFCYILLIVNIILLILIPLCATEISTYLILIKLGLIDNYAAYFIMPLFSKKFFGLIAMLWMIFNLQKENMVKKINVDNQI